MPFDAKALLGGFVAMAMATAPLAPVAARYLDIENCGDMGKVSHIPLPGKTPRDPACPAGCHAVITRRSGLTDDAE